MRTKLGISHVLERRRVFPFLTVKQNLLLGAWHGEAKIQKEKTLDEVYIMFPILADRSNQLAHTMSGGEQQMLAIARGLMGMPKLLMVDEPFLGLSPKMIEKLKEIFNDWKDTNIATIPYGVQPFRPHYYSQWSSIGLDFNDGKFVMEDNTGIILLEHPVTNQNRLIQEDFPGLYEDIMNPLRDRLDLILLETQPGWLIDGDDNSYLISER